MMPCSMESPRSAFAFSTLDLFDILSAEAKLSASRYYSALQRQSNNILPHLQPDRLWELLRVNREWTYLQLLKHNGMTVILPRELGSLALRCPACPRLGRNYAPEDVMVALWSSPTSSMESPRSAFAFSTLDLFDILSAEAKLSASRYYSALQRQSNNILPHLQPDRLRELLRVNREWTYLQLLKHNGMTVILPRELGSLALRCPACPRLGRNYAPEDVTVALRYAFAQELSYDGSFQLIRKNKNHDAHDQSLTELLLYWVSQSDYARHLEDNRDTPYQQSTKGDRCNNHRAANDTWVRQSGVAETGLGAVTCARHTFYMPQGCVNYYKGERYAYTDYAIASVMSGLMQEGATDIGVFYDIFCQWGKNFWARAPLITLPSGELKHPERFFGGIPKYHLAGHIDSCYARYSLNNMSGVGRLDAEGCERGWADLNGASGSTSEKGPGARIDSLNHCMNDWNWRKTISMIIFLIKKWEEAMRMSLEQEEAWLALHDCLDRELTSEWEQMSTAPRHIKGDIWTSVFLMDDKATTTRLRKVLELNSKESARAINSGSAETGYTAPSWISDGIDIENTQRRLAHDVKELGELMTERQRLEVIRRRVALSSRVTTHRQSTAMFIDLTVTLADRPATSAKETGGQPEKTDLFIPSQIIEQVNLTERSTRVIAVEADLRRSECMELLQHVRTASIQKAQLLIGKKKNARGEVANTRAQGMLNRLTTRINASMVDYNASYKALLTLGTTEEQARPLQKLTSNNFKGLMTILQARRDVEPTRKTGAHKSAEGHRRLPWFWTVREGTGSSKEAEEEEYSEGMCPIPSPLKIPNSMAALTM
ncbi:hypothetical protein RSAG8_07114, partial [Rhizoctonia solani AG-8 WAC10335]